MLKRLLSIGLLAMILGLSACNKDGDESASQFSKTEAQTKINEFNATATKDLQDLTDADGIEAVKDLFDLTEVDDPFGRIGSDKKKIKEFFRGKGREFKSIFVKENITSGRTNGDQPFDFNANKGVYTWDATAQQFSKTGESTIIRILFPTEGSPTNNAELQLKAYEEVSVFDADLEETWYEPTLLKASLLVNGTEVASLDFTAQWDELGFPVKVNMTAKVHPYTATVSYDVTAPTKSTLSTSLLKNQETLISTSVTVTYSDTSKSEESLKTIDGFVQLKNLKLQGNINIEAMVDSPDGDLNSFIKMALYSDNKKLGDVIFVSEMVDGYDESVPYLKYADGTKERLEDVLKPVIDEIDALING